MTTICRHIKVNGERCGSPALRDHALCYFHRNLAHRHRRLASDPVPTVIHPLDPTREPQTAAAQPALDLPPLEDRESIQLANGYAVTETTFTSTGDEIAPDEDPAGAIAFQEFLQDLGLDEDEEDAEVESNGGDPDNAEEQPLSPPRLYLAKMLAAR